MSHGKDQSAIAEMRDQLFLDTADGVRLNVVTSNLGLDRPLIGFTDDSWRAAAKVIALQPKIVRNILHRIMEICVGPQKARIGVIDLASQIGEDVLQLDNASDLIQLGTITIDPGLSTEETLDFCFRDLETNRVFVNSDMAFAHTTLEAAGGHLRSAVISTATTLPLIDTSTFPTSGFPYSVILDRGKEIQEIVQISANSVATNQLTCSATTFAHDAPTVTFLRRSLNTATIAGRLFIKLGAGETRDFPASGFVRIDFDEAEEEVREYTENQASDDVLILEKPLEFDHAVGDSAELMNPGASVETVSVIQNSVDWEIFETEANKVKVFIPSDFMPIRLIDASYLHDTVSASPASDTTSAAVSIGDTELPLVSVLGFPTAGLIDIDSGTEITLYNRILSGHSIETSGSSEPFVLADGETLLVSVDGGGALTATFNTADFVDITAGSAEEVALVINTDITGATAYTRDGAIRIHSNTQGTIEITGGTANPTLNFDTPTLVLAKALENAFGGATTVDEITEPYAGAPLLEEGNLRDAGGAVQANQFSGPYIYDVTQRGPSDRESTLATAIAPPTRVAVNSVVNQTNLEVEDASLFPAAPQDVRVGDGTGFREDRNLSDVTLKETAPGVLLSTLVDAPGFAPGVNSIDGDDTIGFPESDGTNPAGYRIIIDRGGGNEETITVVQNTAAVPGTFTFTTPTSETHATGETIELLNDVLTFDQLTQSHVGTAVVPPTSGHLVQVLLDEIELVAGAAFAVSGGYVWINFGKEIINQRKKITTVVAAAILELESTDDFPTSGFPYQVVVSEGRPEEELGSVAANNTTTDRLTFSPALANTHLVDSYVRFESGAPESFEYTSRSGTTLSMTQRTFGTRHIEGERVVFSPQSSTPSTEGSDYAFLLPPDPAACVSALFELVRAAGIEIVFLSDR